MPMPQHTAAKGHFPQPHRDPASLCRKISEHMPENQVPALIKQWGQICGADVSYHMASGQARGPNTP